MKYLIKELDKNNKQSSPRCEEMRVPEVGNRKQCTGKGKDFPPKQRSRKTENLGKN